MNRACTFISMHPSNIIFFPLLFCRKSLTRWKCLRHCHKSHNVSPHTASDFLAQGLGQLLGRCAQETSDLFVTKATTTSQCPLHLVEMHIWYLKKKQKNPVLCPRFWWTSGLGNRYVCWKDRPSGIFHRERVTWSKWTKHKRKFTFKQRQHFANKGLYSQSYSCSSNHVQMWELDLKEDWAPKNWCFGIVVLKNTLESLLDCKQINPVHS